jgi:anti-sigma-K factor RskA
MDITAQPELASRLAAAYAIGTLRGGARRRFEALARQRPALRAQVLLWQEHFAAMSELQAPETPSPEVWKRIANVIAAEARPAADPSVLQRLQRHLGAWRGAALAATFASVVAVVVALQAHQRPEVEYVAVLADDKRQPAMLVTFDPRNRTLSLKRVGSYSEGADRSLQLWALPAGRTPQSLGVIDAARVVRLDAADRDIREVPALAISLEPKGGAPAGSGPTGPVLFHGALLSTSM